MPYRDLAAQLNPTETTLRLAVFRSRQKLRSQIVDETHHTASTRIEAADQAR